MVLASGARYRRLDVENLDAFEASSVHYWASPLEARLCANQEVALVGAGNSAGQAAVYLASQGTKVYMLVRRSDLAETMSRYLVDRISGLANIEVVTGATISALEGSDGVLNAVRWQHRATGQDVRRAINHLFLFIGADPNTDWLEGSGDRPRRKGLHPHRSRGRRRGAMRWRRRAAEYLLSATCAQNRSSASPRRSAKAPRWWRRCTLTWRALNLISPAVRSQIERPNSDLKPDNDPWPWTRGHDSLIRTKHARSRSA